MLGTVCGLGVCRAFGAPASAQQKEPMGRFAAALGGIFARHKVEPDMAQGLGVSVANLPVRSFGLAAGAHFYPWRTNKITFGRGGEFVCAGGTNTLDILGADGKTTTQSPTVRRHFTSIAPELSLNFGHRNGWSYISGGMFGRAKVYADRLDKPATDVPARTTLNYGGGARGFTSQHGAFSVDFRWDLIAQTPAPPTPAAFPPPPPP